MGYKLSAKNKKIYSQDYGLEEGFINLFFNEVTYYQTYQVLK